jgi:serine/threonine protein kinase
MSIGSGDVLDSRYRLLERLGAGAQGEVWRAEDTLLRNAPVALKLVGVDQRTQSSLERVRREARTLNRLKHSSLVPCSRTFEDLGLAVLGLVFEYVDGIPLSAALKDRRFSRWHREYVLWHLAMVLRYLHSERVVHRDVKPANILVHRDFYERATEASLVKLVDLGIATAPGAGQRLTEVGRVIGTAPFMAPEQLEPHFWKAADDAPAVDMFAFSCVAHELLVGGHPTGLPDSASATEFAVAYRAYCGRPFPISTAPSELWKTAMVRGLSVDASRRFPDGAALVQALALPQAPAAAPRVTDYSPMPLPPLAPRNVRSLAELPATSDPVLAPPRLVPSSRRGLAVVGAAALGVGVLLAAIFTNQSDRETSTTTKDTVEILRIPDGQASTGYFVPAFGYLDLPDAAEANFLGSMTVCRASKLSLCTESQWARVCASAPSIAQHSSWILGVDRGPSGDALVPIRGGPSCEARSLALPSAPRAGSGVTCCERVIASDRRDANVDVLGRFEKFGAAADKPALLRGVLAPHLVRFYANLRDVDREKAIEASVQYPGAIGSDSAHDACTVKAVGESTLFDCQHYLISVRTLSQFHSNYEFSGGLISSAADLKPVVELSLQ